MKKPLNLLVLLLLFSFTGLSAISAQTAKYDSYEPEVFVESWQKGDTKIVNQAFRVVLSPKNKSFAAEVAATNGKKYKLFILHNSWGKSIRMEHWQVELHEMTPQPKGNYKFGTDLFRKQKNYPPETDSVFEEDNVGVLYPGEPLFINPVNGPAFEAGSYYIKTVRKIKVENFCVVIRVGDFQFNQKNKNRLDSFEVFVEFKDSCEN